MPSRVRCGLEGATLPGHGMFGIDDPFVLAAYVLSILGTVFCVIYGAVHWNRGDGR